MISPYKGRRGRRSCALWNWHAWACPPVGGGVNPRKSGGENACLHGSKRENAALTAMHQRIAPPPRQGCASPGCIRPQPALDPATGRFFIAHAQHFLCQKKTFRQIYADFDRHQHRRLGGSLRAGRMVQAAFLFRIVRAAIRPLLSYAILPLVVSSSGNFHSGLPGLARKFHSIFVFVRQSARERVCLARWLQPLSGRALRRAASRTSDQLAAYATPSGGQVPTS